MFYSNGPEKKTIVGKCSVSTVAAVWCWLTAGATEA